MITAITIFSGNAVPETMMMYAADTLISASAMILLRVSITRCSSQFLIDGPIRGSEMSHLWYRDEDLAKKDAASRAKGVLGNSGRAMPAKARASAVKPRNRKRCRFRWCMI